MDTTFATNDPLTVKLWAKELHSELPKDIFWAQYRDRKGLMPIHEREDLMKAKGDNITIGLRMQLSGSGVSGDGTLEGSEEALSFFNTSVTIDQRRHATKLNGQMTERRIAFDLRSEAKSALREWIARFIDDDFFTKLDTSPSKTIYAGAASSTATLGATDYFTLALISKVKAYARTASPLLRPMKVGSEEYWLIVIHPHQGYDLKINDPNYASAQRDAQDRGSDNPLFTGALGKWDNTVIKEHQSIATATTWGPGSVVAGASAIFVGAQAAAICWGSLPFWAEKSFDYANQVGFATGAIWGVKKLAFNSKDFGSVSCKTARTNIS
jgi:N4-gp56 family major capsid protein